MGGKADVEAAMLASGSSPTPSELDDAEYVEIKKLRLGGDTDDDRALAPLAHEVNLLNTLSHEGVVQIVGFVEEVEQGVTWMVFAWEKNGNLREFIQSAKWELPERISLIYDVARGLTYLQERDPPICHGDLKSLNILVNSKHRAMITDFGSARTVGLADERAVKGVRAAKAYSTPRPDAMLAQNAEPPSAEIAPSGDFITMTGPAWTAVTGNFPFDKENDTAVVLRIAKGDLPPIENDNQLKQIKVLCSLMRECWTLDIRERPTALRCQQIDQTMPSPRGGNSSTVTRSNGLLFALGRVQLRNDLYTEAREYFEQSLAAATSVGDEWGEARAYQGIGDVSYLQNEYSKAEESYIKSRDIYPQIGNERGIAQSAKRLGDVYRIRAEYSKAEEACMQARTIYSQIGEQLGLDQSVASLGDVYRMRAEYSKAEKLYIQAREIYSQTGSQLGFAQSVHSLGDVYLRWGDSSKAEESYTQAREI
ncbi:Receptor-interacting serine/threonine-protein kinase 3 [Tulasnella sp. UAMH 9824]|nr:Receptor-interacting serine/threonine-protein kinase 3 [Tulasnella sp. UAMH 9824]